METTQHKRIKVSTPRATLKQKKALELTLVANGGKSKAEILRDAGYSPAVVKNPERVFGSDYFRAVLHELVDDRALIERVNEIALDEDKRSSLQAIDMLLKLKDRYPAGKLKIQDYQDEINDITDISP